MYFILLTICICTNTVRSDDSSDSADEGKFIDLLPEDEKKAFIESVARRLIDGVKTKESKYKSDEEISEESLNQHSSYVNKVLQQESLRRNIKKTGEERVQDDKGKVQDDDDKDHIDLTLRQNNRHKRNENEEFIPVQTVYDDENKFVNKTYDDNIKKSKEVVDENSTSEDIQVRGLRSRGSRQATDRPELSTFTKMENFEPDDSSDSVEVATENDNEHNQSGQSVPQSIYDPNASDNDSSKESAENVVDTTSTLETTVDVTTDATTPESFKQDPSTDKSQVSKEITTNKNEITDEELTTIETEISDEEKAIINGNHLKRSLRNETNIFEQEEEIPKPTNDLKVASIFNDNETKDSDSENKTDVLRTDNISNKTKDLNETYSRVDTKPNEEVTQDSYTDTKKSNIENVSNILRSEVNTNASNEYENSTESSLNNTDEISYIIEDVDTTILPTGSETTTISPSSNEIQKHIKIKQEASAEDISTVIIEGNYMTTVSPSITIEEESQEKNKETNLKEGPPPVGNVLKSIVSNILADENTNSSNTQNASIKIYSKNENIDIPTKTKYLRTDLNDDVFENISRPLESGQNDNKKYSHVKFVDISEYDGNVLTTTENSFGKTPNYSIYYAKYVNTDDKNSSENKSRGVNESIEKEEIDIKYEKQSDNLDKIAKELRQRNYDPEEKALLLQPSGNVKEYLVYEVAADEIPFVKTEPKPQPKPKEQPYYVPVYNYAPSNAYYNAYNRLGPNEDDSDSFLDNQKDHERLETEITIKPEPIIEFYSDISREYDNRKKFKYNSKRPKNNFKLAPSTNNFIPLPFVINKPKFTKLYFHPDEYVDMDYYIPLERSNDKEFSRSRKKHRSKNWLIAQSVEEMPFDSSDEMGPYDVMGLKGVKNHINAVRQMLFAHRHFGYVKEITSPKTDIETTTTKSIYDDGDETYYLRSLISDLHPPKNIIDHREISMDYYFGNPNSDDENNRKSKRYAAGKVKNGNGKQKGRMRRKNNGRNKKDIDVDKAEWRENAGTVKDIIAIGQVEDAFPTLKKLQGLDLKMMRRRHEDPEVKVYVNVLRDMLKMNNRALERFDWLGSTVDILGGLKKLKYLTENQDSDAIHPSDLELLKYVQYLFKTSKSSTEQSQEAILRKPKHNSNALPRNKHRKREYLTSEALNNLLVYFRLRNNLDGETSSEENFDPEEFSRFLDDWKNSLSGLHEALKYVSMVTKYKHQKWLHNLKSLYLLDGGEKEILELLLHIFTTRLLDDIERSTENGLANGYLEYVGQNQKEVERTNEEFLFVHKLVNEIKKLNNSEE